MVTIVPRIRMVSGFGCRAPLSLQEQYPLPRLRLGSPYLGGSRQDSLLGHPSPFLVGLLGVNTLLYGERKNLVQYPTLLERASNK